MLEWLMSLPAGAIKIVEAAYKIIFPEFPAAGLFVLGLAVLLFIFYLFKSGPKYGFKIFFWTFVGLSLFLFAFHHIMKLIGAIIPF